MPQKLNFLYCCNDAYAPCCGVSILSLLKANTSADEITVYLVYDAVSEENILRLQQTVADFGPTRHLELVDGKQTVERLKKNGMGTYRGGQAANLRLFFTEYISPDVKRLLYLDCDTLICEDLSELFETEMGTDPVAAVRDALTADYKIRYGLLSEDTYFNSGVLLFDIDNWKAGNCSKELQALFEIPEYRGTNNDQDYLNRLLFNRLTLLSPRYNLQTTHCVFSDKAYFSVCPKENYYTSEELREARENPAIIHAYRFLGQFVWTENSAHPLADEYIKYLKQSQWKDCGMTPNVKSVLFFAERLLYKILPKACFFRLFYKMQNRHFNAELQKRRSEYTNNEEK